MIRFGSKKFQKTYSGTINSAVTKLANDIYPSFASYLIERLFVIIKQLFLRSKRFVVLGNDIESSFHIGNENVTILDVDTEFSFNSFMDVNASFDVNESSLVTPVGVERDWYALG